MKSKMNQKGITLIELMVALVILAIAAAAIYRLYISQSRAYSVQDKVVEVQQNIRTAMEILVRDIRMAGCDDDSNAVTVNNPIVPGGNAITVNYEYFNQTTLAAELRTVTYSLAGTNLQRQETAAGVVNPAETILENVNQLTFTFGIDANNDGYADNPNNFVAAGAVGTAMVIAVRVQLAASPTGGNPDDLNAVQARRLDSIVTMRNQISRSLSAS